MRNCTPENIGKLKVIPLLRFFLKMLFLQVLIYNLYLNFKESTVQFPIWRLLLSRNSFYFDNLMNLCIFVIIWPVKSRPTYKNLPLKFKINPQMGCISQKLLEIKKMLWLCLTIIYFLDYLKVDVFWLDLFLHLQFVVMIFEFIYEKSSQDMMLLLEQIPEIIDTEKIKREFLFIDTVIKCENFNFKMVNQDHYIIEIRLLTNGQ